MKAQVSFEINSPIDCTEEQFEEWIEYCLQQCSGISMQNPLHEYDLDLSNNGEINFVNIEAF